MAERNRILVVIAPGSEPERELPGLEALAEVAEVHYADSEQTLRRELPEAEVVAVTDFRSDLLRRVWPEQSRIRWVHATSAGVDALMFPALSESDITVTNARGIFDRGIAEYVLGAVLLFAKDSIGNLQLQRERRWRHRETELIEGRRALVIGAGSIGQQVAQLLTAAGLEVDGTARSAREQPPFRRVHAQQQLPELLPEADFVVITAPLTEHTRGLMDYAMLSRMKPGARLINVGRGPVVVTDDLLRALREQRLAGAALDVFEEEPLPAEHPLWEMPNVMISAHMAGDFIGWQRALADQFTDNFQRWRQGKSLRNVVDLQSGRPASTS